MFISWNPQVALYVLLPAEMKRGRLLPVGLDFINKALTEDTTNGNKRWMCR